MTEKKRIELISCAEKLQSFCSSRDRCCSIEHPEDKCLFWFDRTGCILKTGCPQNYMLDTLIQSDNRLITNDEISERCKGV